MPYIIGQLCVLLSFLCVCVLLLLSFIFFSLVHSDIVIAVFILGLVSGLLWVHYGTF